MPALPVCVIVPTFNEERGIQGCLQSVTSWAGQIIVLDSFSTDGTPDVVRQMQVHLVQRRFDNFSDNKNWALSNLPLRYEWVFFLDADEWVTRALRDEIAEILGNRHQRYDGYYVGRRNYFMGKWIRHGGWYPNWNLRFFRRRLGRFEQRIVHEHVIVDGRVGYLKNDLLHYDYKGLERYFERHNVYSSMEALEAYRLLQGGQWQRLQPRLFTRGPERRRLLKEMAYRYIPCRSLFKFLWMYVFQAGFLDGAAGFRYSLLHAFYEYQVSLKLLELRTDPSSAILEKYGASLGRSAETGPGREVSEEMDRHCAG